MKEKSFEIIKQAEDKLTKQFERVSHIAFVNQEKVLKAFQEVKIGEEHFYSVSGYGHDDLGREAIDNIFAKVFHTEKAIVRNHFVSGTHTLACVLFGNLRYGEELVSIAGAPYDTMEEVIGKRGNIRASLIGHGIKYKEIPLKNGMDVDLDAIDDYISKDSKVALIQRSRGYSLRRPLTVDMIAEIVKRVKAKNPDCICFVDNCYGEFVEELEPTDVGVDILAGSLIKNPGGGIVETGGYIAGKEEFVDMSAMRLTAPGIGSKGGAMLNQSRLILQGIFMAPAIVAEAVKGALLAAEVLETIGFRTSPLVDEKRTDIIQTIEFGSPEPLIEFCKTLQSYSPVDSYLTPIPDDVPGYDDKLIMAGGSFIEGSTIELSADGPLRAPYAAYMQGGLNYSHVKLAIGGFLDSYLK